jgi:hypothetical protein
VAQPPINRDSAAKAASLPFIITSCWFLAKTSIGKPVSACNHSRLNYLRRKVAEPRRVDERESGDALSVDGVDKADIGWRKLDQRCCRARLMCISSLRAGLGWKRDSRA